MISLEAELGRQELNGKDSGARELRRELREREAEAGWTVSQMRCCLKAVQQGEIDAEQAKKALWKPTSGWSFR
jgi:hypothetical protein